MRRKRLIYTAVTFAISFLFPVGVLADTPAVAPADSSSSPTSTVASATPPTTADASQPAPSTSPAQSPPVSTGPNSPNGAGADTYTYNPTTGLWENQYYTWNPVTHQTQPKTPQDYSYNPATGMWDTTQYVYNPSSGTYVPNVVSLPSDPQQSSTQSPSATSATGPGSMSSVSSNTNNNAIFNLFYNAQISNNISQNAVSGAAAVMGNTVGGNALTGNALDVNNIINMLKSTFGLQNAANLLTFTENINGNVNGDILIDPNQINNSSVVLNNSNTQNNLTINAQGNGAINNNINLGATSGNATVADNTNGGNATTGNASAVANIVNELNSAISANKSFLGVININGNLNGDILLPPNFLDQLLASNAPHATVNITKSTTNNIVANATNNESIGNNVNLAAASGSSSVDNNTNGGSATTGSAGTNLTIFNLTGKQIIAKDSLLVFVNVLGQWVGLIMNAPAGTTAAAIGGNVTENNTLTNNAVISAATNSSINNNVNINSLSGNAAVTDNTNGGNATSGNATSSANIANIIDSQLSSTDWFGLLFINVLGVWHGSFGVNTAAGNIAAAAPLGVSGNAKASPDAVFRFIPKNKASVILASYNNPTDSSSQSPGPMHTAAFTSGNSNSGGSSAPTESLPRHSARQNAWILPIASFGIIMLVTGGLSISGEFTDKLHARLLNSRLGKATR